MFLTMSRIVDAAIGRSFLLHSLYEGTQLAHGFHRAQPLELIFNESIACFLVHLLQQLVGLRKLDKREGCVAICNSLQNGIVDECILQLWKRYYSQ